MQDEPQTARKAWTTPELGLLDDPRRAGDVAANFAAAPPFTDGTFGSYATS